MKNRLRFVGVVVAATAVLLPMVDARADQPACVGRIAADEWPTFGHDLANTRTQAEAGAISTATVTTMAPVWAFATGAPGATGDLNGTPIVAGGCVYLNTAAGTIIALDAATGAPVWQHAVTARAPGLGGTFVSSPAVTDDAVISLVSETGGPYAIAVSRAKGEVLWQSPPLVEGAGYYTNATAVVTEARGAGGSPQQQLLLAGFSPAEGDPTGQGGIAIIDAATGELVKRVFTIPEADQAKGFAGGGIWTAPAVDADGYAYAGTSNPYSKKIEHPNTNAILKIDVDPSRATFGTVVASMKGLIEQYRQEVRDVVDPVCDAYGEDPNLQLIAGDSAPCLQLDLDFGASPNLFTDSTGRTLVGDLQKAGVYHAADTSTMEQVWASTVGATCPACNASAWAVDDGRVVGASSPVGNMVAIGADDGALGWVSPIADGTHYQSTSIAGGVAFTVDNTGSLLAFDVATGVPLLRRPLSADAPGGVAAGATSAGVAIASGMVIAASGDTVVAYAPAG
jgi:outer membrane protein assembly factor BamB